MFNSLGQNNYIIEERITDSILIAQKGKFKINLTQTRYKGDSVFFDFKLFEKINSSWKLIQVYRTQKDGITTLDPIISDFNDDGYFDIAICSDIAARSSNIICKLFIFNKDTKQLTLIKNSDEYPNLRYNNDLKCIDAWLIYGGSSTVFLNLKGDSLKPFAGIDNFENERTVYEVDEFGRNKTIKKDSISDLELYDRYLNYRPLLKCKDKTTNR